MIKPRTPLEMTKSSMEIIRYPAIEIPNARFLVLDFRSAMTNYDLIIMTLKATQTGMKMLQFKDSDFTLITNFDIIWLVGDAQTASMFKLMHDPPIKAYLRRYQVEDLMFRVSPDYVDIIYEMRVILDRDGWIEEIMSRIHIRKRTP